ncbi:MAG: alpha/beta hydrolase [Flavonifractor plautii]
MLCRRVSLDELHPALGGGAPETGLDIYCRGRTGLLADDGARWAVLILPGGGYERIAPAEGEPVALAFLAAGIQAFVLSYSVLPALWPRQFLEGAAALAWMRANAPELGFRPDRVAVCGFSAGGHLAGCLAGGYAEPLPERAAGADAGAGAAGRGHTGLSGGARGPLSGPPGWGGGAAAGPSGGSGPPARLSLGHGGGRHGAGGKYPGLCPRPAGAAGAL